MKTTEALLREIEEACAKATPGPWNHTADVVFLRQQGAESEFVSIARTQGDGTAYDAYLIANARQWLPELCKVVRELQEAILNQERCNLLQKADALLVEAQLHAALFGLSEAVRRAADQLKRVEWNSHNSGTWTILNDALAKYAP